MKGARALQEIYNPDWRNKDGRPDKKEIIKKWREKNPTGKKLIVIEIQKLTLKQFGNGGKNGQDNYQ